MGIKGVKKLPAENQPTQRPEAGAVFLRNSKEAKLAALE